MSYLDGFNDLVIEVRKARKLVHHAVNELSELQQEDFTGRKTVCF